MSTEHHFDLVILGGGPAGTRAAFRAAAAGMRCALVEPCFLGGTCLNVGCIPTKYLLGGTASLPLAATQRKYKALQGQMHVDLPVLQSRKDRFIKGSRQALEKQLREAGITVFQGKGSFTGEQRLTVAQGTEQITISYGKCIVATGSVPASFPGLKPDGQSVHASAGLLAQTAVPESLIIVGGGAIGLELGEIYHRLGAKIVLVEALPRILPSEEPEVSAAAQAHFSKEGWTIHTERRIASLSTENGRSLLRFEDGEELHAEASLLAVGRSPATSGLGLEHAGGNLTGRGWIDTDAYLQCAEHIYAVGDCNGRTLLAHAADHQARYAVDHILGEQSQNYTPPAMPSCVYGTFEIMRVGPTLKEVQGHGDAIGISQAPLAANAIAQSYGHPQGFVRMLWRNDELCAVSAAGHGVSHLVSAAALLVAAKTKKNHSCPIIFAHPTLDEVLESAMVAPMENAQ